jgi:thiamine-monophosphate kinase
VAEGNEDRPAGTVTEDGSSYAADTGHAHFRS